MKVPIFRYSMILSVSLLLAVMPALIEAQPQPSRSAPPPIGPQPVREGEFATRLVAVLGITVTDDEIEAESRLSQNGITPKNGWIADYPVTPDIIFELQKTLEDAADSGSFSISKTEAIKRLNELNADLGLLVSPYARPGTGQPLPESAANYPDPSAVDNYYYSEGPPVVTYYTPPPDYYYLYAWVPSPFWYSSFWFPGFFILHDFHRISSRSGRGVLFVSNHFSDIRADRVFRVDPVARFSGRTFAGIGAPRTGRFLSTGTYGGPTRIFHASRERITVPRGSATSPAFRSSGPGGIPFRGGTMSVPSGSSTVMRTQSRSAPMMSPSSRSSTTFQASPGGGRTMSSPSRGVGGRGSSGGGHGGGGHR